MGDIRYKGRMMKNPVLDKIKAFAIKELTDAYGFCGLAENDDVTMLNSNDAEGNDIAITIKAITIKIISVTEQKKQEEFEQQTGSGYKNDDGGNLPNG